MPDKLTSLRVFVASPGGLEQERQAFREAIDEANEADANPRGIHFVAVGWEDTLGGIGRPQSIINQEVRSSDYFVMLLRDRWGSQTGVGEDGYTSGVEEEYHVAMECCANGSMRNMVIMFGQVEPQQLSDPEPQLQRVLAFRMQLEQEKQILFHTFDTPTGLKHLLRKYLSRWIRDEESGRAPSTATTAACIDLVAESAMEDAGEAREEGGLEPVGVSEAWSLAEEGRLTEAEVAFARQIVAGNSPRPLIDYAVFVNRLGRADQAEALLRSSVEVATDQGDERAQARAQIILGSVLEARGDLNGAQKALRDALEIAENTGWQEGMADAYGNLGIILDIRGDLAGAEEMQRKALEMNEGLGRLVGTANAYGNLGFVLMARGDLDGAEEMHRKALEIHERLGQGEGIANAYGNVGNVLKARGDLDGAEAMHCEALAIDERLGRLEGVADDYGNLGNVLSARGDLNKAEEMLRKALGIHERLGRLEGVATAYHNLGGILKARGDAAGAEEMDRKALETEQRLG